jgi:cysteinyl-tRNA synthetase
VADSSTDKLEGTVNMFIGMRNQAEIKKLCLSDQIRDQLNHFRHSIEDGKDKLLFTV